MKTNLLYSLKSNTPGSEKCIEEKAELSILLLLLVALALAGCEGMTSGSSGPSSPWPAAPTGHSTPPASQTGVASALDGRWYHDGKPTSIKVDPDGRTVTVIDENGFRTYGNTEGSRSFVITSMASFEKPRGTLSPDGKRISWSNGGTWTREPHHGGSGFGQAPAQGSSVSGRYDGGFGFGHAPGQGSSVSGRYDGGSGVGQAPTQAQNISGRWYHDGKPTSISVSGQTVTITNEVAQSSSGSISGNEIVIFGGPSGRVSDGGRRISWSNGTTWTR